MADRRRALHPKLDRKMPCKTLDHPLLVLTAAAWLACASTLAIAQPAVVKPAAAATPAAERKLIEIKLAAGSPANTEQQTLRVKKGDDVELRWTTDKAIVLHLHGYDFERTATPTAPAIMAFKATVPGRFPVSEHRQGPGHHRAVLYLEVMP